MNPRIFLPMLVSTNICEIVAQFVTEHAFRQDTRVSSRLVVLVLCYTISSRIVVLVLCDTISCEIVHKVLIRRDVVKTNHYSLVVFFRRINHLLSLTVPCDNLLYSLLVLLSLFS